MGTGLASLRLEFDSQDPCKKLGLVAHTCNPSLTEVETFGSLCLLGQPKPIWQTAGEKPCLKKQGGWSLRIEQQVRNLVSKTRWVIPED